MHAMAEPLHPFLNKKEQPIAIRRGEENILTAIASKHDVIQPARNMNPWFACHDVIILITANHSCLTPTLSLLDGNSHVSIAFENR